MYGNNKGHDTLLSFNYKSTCLLLLRGKSKVDAAFISIRLNTFTYAQKSFKNKLYANVYTAVSTPKRAHRSTAGSATRSNWEEYALPILKHLLRSISTNKITRLQLSPFTQCLLVAPLVRNNTKRLLLSNMISCNEAFIIRTTTYPIPRNHLRDSR